LCRSVYDSVKKRTICIPRPDNSRIPIYDSYAYGAIDFDDGGLDVPEADQVSGRLDLAHFRFSFRKFCIQKFWGVRVAIVMHHFMFAVFIHCQISIKL
jgi:uncharacterized membrane protein